ncbi:hypothetical protein BAUCODRAFT_63239 [Baudoinia panamericana UAMH 10762]|uniref:VHS domain-containing protein n=1 Tax=Baudoinia panamericana (strain UAMH 10762) TaxID=717646 RepID=M2NKI5_BAUPA|nr:uncharacterized protein BAUCODRAFT_63239 [Baudoinia panamericana UAMH 10762]EMC99640.1 hypothetical protein BAUCODRAFT_63239 [Baudoinia panamericana UAMH 10762]
MEAASARYAARDRFAYPSEAPNATPLQRYIHNACSPENFEPNLALSLEISDLINAKRAGAPREAAVAIVQYVNARNPNVSLLALSLLDICVKNCGYPFHLQISTKEFLNELVRRFPERPPIRTTRVQNRILELIEEWRRTICETSKYKEDLGYIRDMHRLLSYKGYVFPEVRREDAAVLNPSDNLKSAEEMEKEERAAQEAKLQELIRRGTPHDLQEANKLMKVMAGYDTRHKTDYRAKAAEEVAKIQQKAKLLEEMLQGYKPGDEIKEGDVFEELANALASAHPKIQKMCEEESDDTEAVAKLLEINDSIHRTIERYKLVKKGDIQGANAIPRGTLGISGAGVKKGRDNELSLIDFSGPEDAAGSADSAADDLMSGNQQPTSKPATPVPSSTQPSQQAKRLSADPFASLATPPRQASPFQFQHSTKPPAAQQSSGFDLLGMGDSNGTSSHAATANAGGDDEWTFSSALPDQASEMTVTNSSIRTVFSVKRETDSDIVIQSRISNSTAQPISDLTFQLAVTKGYTLNLQPQSSRTLSPNQQNGITQTIRLQGVERGKGTGVKMRWRASYSLGGKAVNEQGELTGLGVP